MNRYDQELADVIETERLKGRRVLVDGRVKYRTEAERKAAKREQSRLAKQRARAGQKAVRAEQRDRAEYDRLCAVYNVTGREDWRLHLGQLRRVHRLADGCAWKAWWLARFPLSEIRRLAEGLVPLNDMLPGSVALSGAAPSIRREAQDIPLVGTPVAAPLNSEVAA